MKIKTLMMTMALTASLCTPLSVQADVLDSAGVTAELQGDTIYTTDYLNVRRNPSTEAEIVTTLPPNSKLLRTASIGDWDTILVSGVEYYVCNDYITMQTPAEVRDVQQVEPVDLDYFSKCAFKKPLGEYLGEYSLTAYCSCSICCGAWGGTTTASGTTPTAGRTVACNSLPFGTKLLINGNIYTVEDTGGMAGNVIDIYMDSHDAALNFGRRTSAVYLMK